MRLLKGKLSNSVDKYGVAKVLVNTAVIFILLISKSVSADTKGPVILMLGDSLTAGYGLAQKDNIPNLLETRLKSYYPNVRVVNGGVSGDTSAGGLSRFDWLTQSKVDIIVIELGANDGLRGLEPRSTFKNLDEILNRARLAGLKVLFTGMKAPPNFGDAYGTEFNNIFPVLAEKHNVMFYPFFLEGVVANKDLNQADGIHPNEIGVNVIVENLLPFILRLAIQ